MLTIDPIDDKNSDLGKAGSLGHTTHGTSRQMVQKSTVAQRDPGMHLFAFYPTPSIILVPTVDFDGSTTSDLEKTKATVYNTRGKGKQNVPASQGDPGMHLFAFYPTPSIILVPTVDFDGSTTSDLEKTKATSYTNRGKGKENVPASQGDPGMHLFAFKSHSQHYT